MALLLKYDEAIESAVGGIASLLKGNYGVAPRALALLLLQGDPDIETLVKKREADRFPVIQREIDRVRANYNQPLSYLISLHRQRETERILADTVKYRVRRERRFADTLSRLMINPVTGIPILLIILYFGLYQFVGVLGARILVDFIEKTVFGTWINPWVTAFFVQVLPFKIIQDLFVGEYGIVTLGLTYAFAIILPIVTTFFMAFSVIEDSGYLPRLALLVDRLFKGIGLSGRAVIPLVLGFGCDTMATVVTRTLETKRERVVTTLLLALAIPCSAQLGVIFAILSGNPRALLIWVLVMVLTMLLVGYLATKIIPGEKASFYMEVPPLRRPHITNVLVKTYSRLHWYFAEVLPIFMLASVLLWAGKLTGAFDFIISGVTPLVKLIGLPPETAPAFLYGFFRRDFGAAGLYGLHDAGILVGVPLVVAAVTLTLFVPCIAQFSVMIKERGVKTALAIAVFVFPFAFLVGYVLDQVLNRLGVVL